MTNTPSTGIIRWFSTAKGFGFAYDKNGEDVFIHMGDVEEPGFYTLKSGQYINYHLHKGDKGLEAKHIRLQT